MARGDDEIVSRHLKAIDEKMRQFSKLYRMLEKYTLDIADQRGDISENNRQKLGNLFRS